MARDGQTVSVSNDGATHDSLGFGGGEGGGAAGPGLFFLLLLLAGRLRLRLPLLLLLLLALLERRHHLTKQTTRSKDRT